MEFEETMDMGKAQTKDVDLLGEEELQDPSITAAKLLGR